MKNITVSVDDETYHRARSRAAEEGTSVSRVVRDRLASFAAEPTTRQQRNQALEKLYAEIDARFKGIKPMPHDPEWRQKLYEERFDETILGRSLKNQEK